MLGFLIIFEGFFMLAASAVELFYIENLKTGFNLLLYGNKGFSALVISGTVTTVFGAIFYAIGFSSSKRIGIREGYSIVSLVWILFSIFGMLPLLLSDTVDSITDAFFESMSGFTTTGSSVIADVESLPHSLLLWRSLTEWIGGMGIVVLSLAVLPFLGGSMQLFSAEASGGHAYNKIAPRVKDTARRLWGMYAILTLILATMLHFEGMNIFDAVNHALTTMASGGYSTKNTSIGYWNLPLIHYTITFFMIITGINFTYMYLAIFQRNFSKLLKDEEFKTFIFAIIIALTIIFINNALTNSPIATFADLEKNFRESLFQTASIISTTGFSIDTNVFLSSFMLILCILLMISGACSGSTTGGIKMIRVVIIFKNCYYELRRLLHPNAVLPIKINNRVMQNSVALNVFAFIILFVVFLLLGIFMLMLNGMSASEAFFCAISSITNNCLSISNFASDFETASSVSKWIMATLMLTGRLEIFTIVLLFSPELWKK